MSFFEWSPPTEILSDISILTSYLAYSLTFYLAFDLTSLLTFYLTSCTRNWGPAVPTEIWRSRLTAESEELQGDEKAEGGQQHKIWPGGEKWQAGALDSSTPIHPCIVPVHCGQACGHLDHLDHLVVSRENMQKPMGFWSCLPSKNHQMSNFQPQCPFKFTWNMTPFWSIERCSTPSSFHYTSISLIGWEWWSSPMYIG